MKTRKRSLHILLILFLLVAAMPIISRCQVKGIVVDDKTHAGIENADIFINKTAVGTLSDESGHFTISDVSSGLVEIIIYKSGYSIYRSFMRVQDNREYNLSISLERNDSRKTRLFTEDEISWLKNEVVKSDIESLPPLIKNTDTESITLKNPLVATNKSLGYKSKIFIASTSRQQIRYAPIKYEQLPGASIRENIEIEKSRQTQFNGSLRHWLIAITKNQLKEKGYQLSDSAGASLNPDNLLSPPVMPGYFRFYSRSRVIVHYNRNGTDELSSITMTEPLDFNLDGVLINTKALKISGKMADPGLGNQVPNDYREIEGNVEEIFQTTIQNLFEKTYIHTDKDYYYPGERVWFKIYMNYFLPTLRDSLSSTLYVELIDHKRRVISEKILDLDSGFTANEFVIPDSCKNGTYYLRAYTQLQRNFGPAALQMKPLPILKLTQRPVYFNVDENERTSGLSVHTNKQAYKRREKVELSLALVDEENQPMSGNFSISITDASQVLKIPDAQTITKGFPIDNKQIGNIDDLPFMVENGFSIYGQFLNTKGRGEATTLNIIQLSPYNLNFVDTDSRGFFQRGGLQFYGERSFSITPIRAKGQTTYGTIKTLPRNAPEITIANSSSRLEITEHNSQQRTYDDYKISSDAKLLDAVEIKANRENDLYIKNVTAVNHPYGVGEYVFGEDKIKTQFPNLLYSIQAMNIAGLIISPTEPSIYFARHMKPQLYHIEVPDASIDQEIGKRYAPMVTLDGTPMNGAAADALISIDPNTVASIEITRHISPVRGLSGSFGVISVFTKSGYKASMKAQAGITPLTIQGYADRIPFSSPDYSASSAPTKELDNRTTLYWNPSLKNSLTSGKATVNFFTSDLTGSYRIVVEGVDARGTPVRSVTFIKIED